MLSPKQIAYEFSISYKTVLRLIKRQELRAYKIGRHYKIMNSDLKNYIQQSVVKTVKK